jgi:hypothetical protein
MDTGTGGGTTLPPEITDAQVNSGIGTTPVLFTPAKAKGMIEDRIPPEITDIESRMNLNHILCRGWREQYWVCSNTCSSLS